MAVNPPFIRRLSLFVILLIALLLFASCRRESTADTDTVYAAETGEEYKLSSNDHLNELIAQGTLSTTDAALLELTAAYAPDSVPKSILPENAVPNIMWAENYIMDNWDSFSDGEKERLSPFYVLPDDPSSIHYDRETKTHAVAEALLVVPSALAAGDPWRTKSFTIDAQRRASVHFKNISANAAQADWIGAAFLQAHPIHEQLLGIKPANDLKIYIVEMSAYGSAVMRTDDGVRRCVIKVRSGLDKKMTEATVAHELFHCFQFAIPFKYEKKDMMWLMEATATWSENNVYPAHNSEWEYHDLFFKTLGGNMLYYGDNREYGTYIWPLFLSQKAGSNAVKNLLLAAKSSGATEAVLAIPDYERLFKEYGFYSWNQGIAHKLSDTPDFPEKGSDGSEKKPRGKKSYYKLNAQRGMEQDLGLSLSVFSQYYTHLIVDSTIKKIAFTFDPVPDAKHPVQALLKTAEGWYYEDFEGLSEKSYCQDDDSRIEEIVLILSNSQKESFRPKIIMSTKEECEPEWTGQYKVTWNAQKIDRREGPGGGATITNSVDGSYISRETLAYDAEKGLFTVKTARAHYESQTAKHIDYEGGDCEKYDYEDGVMSGDYTYDFTDVAFPPARMSFAYGDKITGPLSFDVNPVTKQGIRWIHYTEKKSVLPCTSRTEEATAPRITTFEDDYADVTLLPEDEEFVIEASPGDKIIEGEKTVRVRSDQYGEYDANVEYRYQFE